MIENVLLVCLFAMLYLYPLSNSSAIDFSMKLMQRLQSYSLSLSDICIGDVFSLQDLSPEASQLMAVVDLDDVELLEDTAVECKLLILEDGKHLAANVNAHDVVELALGVQIALIPLQVILDLVYISRVLEKSTHRLFTSLNILDI